MARRERLPIYKAALDMTVHFEKLGCARPSRLCGNDRSDLTRMSPNGRDCEAMQGAESRPTGTSTRRCAAFAGPLNGRHARWPEAAVCGPTVCARRPP